MRAKEEEEKYCQETAITKGREGHRKAAKQDEYPVIWNMQ